MTIYVELGIRGQFEKGMDMRILILAAVAGSIAGTALAQTQPTRPTVYATAPTRSSAFATSALSPCYSSINPTSPCYSGTQYPSYSAIEPAELSNRKSEASKAGADSLNGEQAKSRIEEKGYSNVSELQKDDRGIWRGKATMKDGRSVAVILDLDGNIHSDLKP
jgi:Peptidase propeptide and YPEB domain